jgi:hypothetical protein
MLIYPVKSVGQPRLRGFQKANRQSACRESLTNFIPLYLRATKMWVMISHFGEGEQTERRFKSPLRWGEGI